MRKKGANITLHAAYRFLPSSSSSYIGRREKISLELGGKRNFGERVDAGLGVWGFSIHDEESHSPQNKSECTYYGFSVLGNLTFRF